MDNLLNLEKLLELPNKVIKISESEQNKYLDLLSDSTCDRYYYTNLKSDLKDYFSRFNDFKFSYSMPENITLNATAYELKENKFVNRTNDSILNYVSNKVDEEIFAIDTYNKVISLAYKLTEKEAVYFVDCFFADETDDYICEKLQVSRTGLQKIRKSCLVKMYLEFPINENKW